MTTIRDLCERLIRCESEEEVVKLLKIEGYWDREDVWENFGGIENNYSTIGNQQGSPEAALVEKIVNSIDALLMLECQRQNIDPEGSEAPISIDAALEKFYGIRGGILSNLDRTKRKALAENIYVIATGNKKKPCISIIDKGEGQNPEKFPDTFLSLSKSNKLKIPFVQGKFNMGGTGVLRFSGKYNLQLIVSKRNLKLNRDGNWGFTIIRREAPRLGRKSSSFKYLAPEGKILRFSCDSLNVLPKDFPEAYGQPLQQGTIIKLYDYDISKFTGPIVFGLYNRLSVLLPKIALPVRICERREQVKVKGPDTTLTGLKTRLDEDSNRMEDGFPSDGIIQIQDYSISYSIYAFKKDEARRDNYLKDEGILFTINGQTHGSIPSRFFSWKSVGMGYLADSILIICDCSKLSATAREDLFLNSRDRLSDCDLKKEFEKKLETIVKNHEGLRKLKEKRRRDELQEKIADEKPLKEVLENIFKKTPSLSNLLMMGDVISHPFNLKGVGETENYKGKEYPSFFKLIQKGEKSCNLGSRFRIFYETDVVNDYFGRDSNPGSFKLTANKNKVDDFVLHLWNGKATLNVELPNDAKVGDIIKYHSIENDIMMYEPFQDDFTVKVLPEKDADQTKQGDRIKPPSTKNGQSRQTKNTLSLPNIIEVTHEGWENEEMDDLSALKIKQVEENIYDFYINIENKFLLYEIKSKNDEEVQLIRKKFEYALVLIGLALIKDDYSEKIADDAETSQNTPERDVAKDIFDVTKKLAPIILPMIASLSELELEEIG